MNKLLWRKVHRWLGFFLATFLIFYCLTGILLNHRQQLSYFQREESTVSQIVVQKQESLENFLQGYQQQLGRDDAPSVIRIKDDGVIEFLYGSHGRTTYTVDPHAGTLTKTDKIDQQPWYWLNQLHKAAKTTVFWEFFADSIASLLLVLLLSGVLLVRLRRQDIILLVAGLALFLLGLAVA
jgi:uncharacterized iron-regulated membrane protein